MSDSGNLYPDLRDRIRERLDQAGAYKEKLGDVCQLLRDAVPIYDWVGFYLVDPERPRELMLGPFAGEPTDHTRIPFGRGICGQAAERQDVFVIDDVAAQSNYLSCSALVKSEIVLPVFHEGRLVGELDIDSHTLAAFDEAHREFLSQVCELVSEIVAGVVSP